MVDARPDLKPYSNHRTCTLTLKDGSGRIIGGAYMYETFGNAVIDAIWLEPESRGFRNFMRLCKEVIRTSKAWRCDQLIGYSADFIGGMEVIMKKFGAQLYATLDCHAKNYKLHYYCLPLK